MMNESSCVSLLSYFNSKDLIKGDVIPDLVLTVPSVGAFSQQINLRSVDFPAPLGPTSTILLAGWIPKLISLNK
jgi:hypothetical protein